MIFLHDLSNHTCPGIPQLVAEIEAEGVHEVLRSHNWYGYAVVHKHGKV